MFKTRLLSGIVLVIAALVLIITGGDVLLISTLIISYIGMFELYRIFHIEKESVGIISGSDRVLLYSEICIFAGYNGVWIRCFDSYDVRICIYISEV